MVKEMVHTLDITPPRSHGPRNKPLNFDGNPDHVTSQLG